MGGGWEEMQIFALFRERRRSSAFSKAGCGRYLIGPRERRGALLREMSLVMTNPCARRRRGMPSGRWIPLGYHFSARPTAYMRVYRR